MINHRQERIAELLQEELGLLVSAELTDPRLENAMVTVTHVTVSADLHNANVYVDHVLPVDASRHVLSALQRAESFLRRALAENLNLRVVPELSFRVDETERHAHQIDSLLDCIAAQAPDTETNAESDIETEGEPSEHAG